VPPGVTEIEIRQIGFEPGTFDIRIPDSGVVQGVFPLDFNGYLLPAVVVEARAVALMPRYNDFERRRQRKMGAYLRWDEIKKQGYSSVAMRSARFVASGSNAIRRLRVQCGDGSDPAMPPDVVHRRCRGAFLPREHTIIDVYGIEVYRGAGEIPAEFAGSNAACGVIAVWTKSKPYR